MWMRMLWAIVFPHRFYCCLVTARLADQKAAAVGDTSKHPVLPDRIAMADQRNQRLHQWSNLVKHRVY